MISLRPLTLALLLVTLLIVGAMYLLFAGQSDTRYPTAGTTIVVFGDSLAEGQGATKGNDIASLLSERLGRPVLNMGVGGDTTALGLARVDALLAQDPRLVIILLGGNDALQRIPVENTFANLAKLIERIHGYGAAIVLVGEPGAWYGARYEKEYEQLRDTYGTFYVSNILQGLIGRTEYMSDSIHPNDAGYVLATDRIEPEVRRALRGVR